MSFEEKVNIFINNISFKNKFLTEHFILKFKVLIDDVNNYKPQSKMKSYKELILKFIELVSLEDFQDYDIIQFKKLQREYLLPVVYQFKDSGNRFKTNFFSLLLYVIIEILIYVSLSFNFYIPVFSILLFVLKKYRNHKAKIKNRLW